jgi:hypothetical protein
MLSIIKIGPTYPQPPPIIETYFTNTPPQPPYCQNQPPNPRRTGMDGSAGYNTNLASADYEEYLSGAGKAPPCGSDRASRGSSWRPHYGRDGGGCRGTKVRAHVAL